jgi:hypothetical protein
MLAMLFSEKEHSVMQDKEIRVLKAQVNSLYENRNIAHYTEANPVVFGADQRPPDTSNWNQGDFDRYYKNLHRAAESLLDSTNANPQLRQWPKSGGVGE